MCFIVRYCFRFAVFVRFYTQLCGVIVVNQRKFFGFVYFATDNRTCKVFVVRLLPNLYRIVVVNGLFARFRVFYLFFHYVVVIVVDDVENAKFLSFFDRSGYTIKAHFIKNCIFGKSFKVAVRDKSKVDYYIQLTQFYSQFRSIGQNYNQVVKELHSNFSEKKALALLYKLEQCTLELIKTNEMIVMLSRRFEQSYQREGTISADE